MALTNLEGARKEFAALIRKTKDDRIDPQKARLLTYQFSNFLAFLKAEQESEILKRLEALEDSARTQRGQ